MSNHKRLRVATDGKGYESGQSTLPPRENVKPCEEDQEEKATEYQFFDMVITCTENTESSTMRWSKDTVARVVGRTTDMTSGAVKYYIEWQKSPYHGFSTACVSSEDIQPHTDCAHIEPLRPGEAAKLCMKNWS